MLPNSSRAKRFSWFLTLVLVLSQAYAQSAGPEFPNPGNPGMSRDDQRQLGLQAAAQVNQLNQKIQSQDWTRDINYRDQGTGLCATCGQESGGGKFCQGCGHPLAAAESARKFCGNCGTALTGAKFCVECGTPAG